MTEQQNKNALPDWNDLPVPDASEAWQNMQRRLDEDDQRRPVVLPRIVYGCAVIAIGAALLAGGWLWNRSRHDINVTAGEQPSRTIVPVMRTGEQNTGGAKTITATTPTESNDDAITKQPVEHSHTSTPLRNSGNLISKASSNNKNGSALPLGAERSYINRTQKRNNRRAQGAAPAPDRSNAFISTPALKQGVIADATGEDKKRTANAQVNSGLPEERAKQPAKPNSVAAESRHSDTIVRPVHEITGDPIASLTDAAMADAMIRDTLMAAPEKDSAIEAAPQKGLKRQPWKWSAGLTLQQQLRSGNQLSCSHRYDSLRSRLFEQVPSVYLRAQKGKHWFFQLEARYNAPRLGQDFSYSRHTMIDLVAEKETVTYDHLCKTYYHQLPFTANYFVKNNWSVGAGVSYALFYRAVVDREVYEISGGSRHLASAYSYPFTGFSDSFLYRSQWLLLLQTEYQWRSVSVGVRYQHDIEPYIRYTTPEGMVRSRRNHALEALLRFRLWESGRKRNK